MNRLRTPENFLANTPHREFIILFSIALLVRIALIIVLRPYHDLERFELERTAISLATSGVYGNPYAIPTGPTAHVSPGYTLILAAIFRLFGTGVAAEIVKEFLACFVTAISCALIPAASAALTLPRRVGWIAAWITALLPVKPLVQIDGDWEAPYACLFLIFLTILVVKQWRSRDLSLPTAWRLGLVWGLAVIFSSVLLPLFLVTLLCGFYFTWKESIRKSLLSAAVQVTIALLVLLPWIIRNQISLGSPIATRSNFGIELHVSNNDEATSDQRVNYLRGVYDHFHPLQNANEALKVRQMGEVLYNRTVLNETKTWINSHLTRFAYLCIGRIQTFWFYPDPSKPKALFGDLTAVLGIFGFLLLLTRNRKEAGVFVAIALLLYPAPSYLIHVGARQRYPIDWLLTLLAVFAVLRLWELIQSQRSTPVSVARL